jgi:hypothetical protein
MLSYVGAAFFLFIALPIALLGMFTGIGFFGPADIIKALVFGGMGWGTVVSLIITALVCVWELLVAGKAIALARGCTLGRGIFSVILGLGVTGAVMTAIVTLIVAVVRMSYY